MKRVISISMSEELINKIDAQRGLIPRSAAIEEKLKLKDEADEEYQIRKSVTL